MNKVLILGGYGNFGKRIARSLRAKDVQVIVAGRSMSKAMQIFAEDAEGLEFTCFDVFKDLPAQLATLRPKVVINTVGPFQGADYDVAKTCIKAGVHYIDLADARQFVCGFSELDQAARDAGVVAISGASTVPALSSAVVNAYKDRFALFDLMRFGISPGQQAERGLATTKGILSYVGKPLSPFRSIRDRVYGWQDIYRQSFPTLGKRWMANCEIPDLDLLPEAYGIKRIQFSAGMELSVVHLGLWLMSWLVRIGLPLNLSRLAGPLLKISNWFDRFGSADGGMFVHLSGVGANGQAQALTWYIEAFDADGPHIPTIPAILLAVRLVNGPEMPLGAYPCVGLVELDDYLQALGAKAVKVTCI
jgi:hypothetical protein